MEGYERYVGQMLDNRYRIERIIGMGGMAVVFRAEDLLMRRIVAVKILKDDIARDEVSVKRFINESKAVSMLSHPNIVTIYDVSVRSDAKYIVMEYIEGITLKNYMTKKGKLEFREIIMYTEQVLRALEHAHQKGIVHRDIKPQNIMLLKNGIIKVMDFGIAKLPNAETVTVKDSAIGTVYYISPEQASGKPIDARSDIYSLGVMMYEMATGKLPFTADSPVSVALKQINDTAKPVKEEMPSLPLGLSQIIARAMDKDPDMRYQSAQQMLRQVVRLGDNPETTFKPPKPTKKKGRVKTSRGMLPIILAITAAFLIVGIVGGIFLLNKLFLSGDDTKTITVDEFAGKTFTDELKKYFDDSDIYYREATLLLKKMGLRVSTESITSDLYDVGHVISSAPEAGTVLEAGDRVVLYVSTGASGERITVPNFKGKTEKQVLAEATEAGLLIGDVSYEESEDYGKGLVADQSIPSGSQANKNSIIDFVVSLGAPETTAPETTEEVTEAPTDTADITDTGTNVTDTESPATDDESSNKDTDDTEDAVYADNKN